MLYVIFETLQHEEELGPAQARAEGREITPRLEFGGKERKEEHGETKMAITYSLFVIVQQLMDIVHQKLQVCCHLWKIYYCLHTQKVTVKIQNRARTS